MDEFMTQQQKIQSEINSFYKTLFQKYKQDNVIGAMRCSLRLCFSWERYKDDYYFCSQLHVDGTSNVLCTIFKDPENPEKFICNFRLDLAKYNDNRPSFTSFEDAKNYANSILTENGFYFLENN